MKDTYVELMGLWITEQELRLKECQFLIATNEEEIKMLEALNDLNQKQSVLIQKRIDDGKSTLLTHQQNTHETE